MNILPLQLNKYHISQLYRKTKPRGIINSVTEIRDRYQNPNPFPPRRPVIHRLYDTWGGTREGERTKVKNKNNGKNSILAKKYN